MLFELKDGKIRDISNEKVEINISTWEELSHHVFQEQKLVNTPISVLLDRYNRGETIVILHKDRIVCHINCFPMLQDGFIKREGKVIQEIAPLKNTASAYYFSTGWTNPKFRRNGLSTFLRKRFWQKNQNVKTVLMGKSDMKLGLPIFKRLGGLPVEPKKYLFLYILTFINTPFSIYDAFFTGPTRIETKFWVSNPKLADTINQKIIENTGASIDKWLNTLQIDSRLLKYMKI